MRSDLPFGPTSYAIFDGQTDRMDYNFRTYDSTTTWELYGSWIILKDLPKYQNISSDINVVNRVYHLLVRRSLVAKPIKSLVSVGEKLPRPRRLCWPKQQDAELGRRHWKGTSKEMMSTST
jgi:hypothetical protein